MPRSLERAVSTPLLYFFILGDVLGAGVYDPFALFGALLTAGLVYVLVGVVASAAVPTDELARSSGPLLEMVRRAVGVPDRLFSVIALVAVARSLAALASCHYLFTRIDAEIWARGLVLVGLGAVLALVNSVRTRRAHPESRIARGEGDASMKPCTADEPRRSCHPIGNR